MNEALTACEHAVFALAPAPPLSQNTTATGYKAPLSFQLTPICFNQSHAAAFPQENTAEQKVRAAQSAFLPRPAKTDMIPPVCVCAAQATVKQNWCL